MSMTSTHHRKPSWPMIALGAICVAAIALSILLVGPAPASQSTVNRTAKVSRGVVQSTVSGSGNLQPASELNLGFKTSGTVTHIYVHAGQQVAAGQLLATLDPQNAEATLQQARAALQSAEAGLASTEETGSSAQSAGTGSTVSAGAASITTTRATTMAPASTTTAPGTSTTPKTTTSPAAPAKSTSPSRSGSSSAGSSAPSEASSGAGSTGGSSTTSAGSSISTAAREANIASARAAVHSDELSVQSAEEAVRDTKLVAPEDGTIASLAGQVGEVVSGGGTTRASSTASTGSSSSAGGSGAAQGTTSAGSSSSSSSSSGSAASGFAVLTNLSSMRLVVPLSESEIGSVRKGQIATVTIEALKGRKVAAHVGEVATLSTSNSGVVSYDVTFDLDQMESGLKPGMSAAAEVVVKQAEGLNVPTSAITGGSVTVVSGSKRETRRVTTGLAGNSSTIVLSGLKAGETVALPSASTTRSSTGAVGAARGARGIGGGLGGLGGGGFAGGGGLPRGGG
jgi:HlyD family secretion protein